MKVRDAIRKSAQTIEANQSIVDAARQMDEAAVGALIVVDDGLPIGIVTDRDLVVRGLAQSRGGDARVDGVMSSGVIALGADVELRDAIPLFRDNAIRRLPVVDGDQVCGMLTLDDLVIDFAQDLADVVRPIAAQVLFGHREAKPPVPAA